MKFDPCCLPFVRENPEPLSALGRVKNVSCLSPEIDLENYLVRAHLDPLAAEADALLGELGVYELRAIFVTEDTFKGTDCSDFGNERVSSATARVPMPKGLYAHLVALSSAPRVGFPDVVDPQLEAFLERLEAVVFGPGTRNGQRIWAGWNVFWPLVLMDHPRFEKQANWIGVLRHKTDPNETRVLEFGLSGVPDNSVLFDDRTKEEIVGDAHQTGAKTPSFKPPKWLRGDAVIETHVLGFGLVPGLYHIWDMSRGFQAEHCEVVLRGIYTGREGVVSAAFLMEKGYVTPVANSYAEYRLKDATFIPVPFLMEILGPMKDDNREPSSV